MIRSRAAASRTPTAPGHAGRAPARHRHLPHHRREATLEEFSSTRAQADAPPARFLTRRVSPHACPGPATAPGPGPAASAADRSGRAGMPNAVDTESPDVRPIRQTVDHRRGRPERRECALPQPHSLTTLCDGKLKRIGLFTGSSSCLHAQLVAVSLEPESSGDAGVGLQPSELGDAAAQLDPCRARLMAPLGEPGEEGAAALAPDQQSTTDQSSYCCPDGRPGDAQAPHQLRFWGMRSPIRYRRCTSRSSGTFSARAYKGIRRSGGSVAGSPRAGHAAVSGHTLMLRNRHIVSAEKDEFILLTYQFV